MIEHPSLQIGKTCWGFGYDSKHDEYKIVAAGGFQKNMFVYRLKEEQWKHLPQCAVKDGCGFKHHVRDQTARFMNNRLHWTVFSNTRETGKCSLIIARFNLSSEEWNDPKKETITQSDVIVGQVRAKSDFNLVVYV